MDFVTDGCMVHDLAYSSATRHQSLDHGVEKDLFSWQNLFSEMLDLHGFVLLCVYQEYPSFSLHTQISSTSFTFQLSRGSSSISFH